MSEALNPQRLALEAKALVDTNVSEPLTAGEIAKLLGVGYERLNTTFYRWYNMSVAKYIRQVRRQYVFKMLCDPRVLLGSVHAEAGIDRMTLGTMVKERTGMTPKKYREYLQVAQ